MQFYKQKHKETNIQICCMQSEWHVLSKWSHPLWEISRISCGSRWPFCKLEPTQLSTQLSCLLSNEMYITSQPLISSACLACRTFWFPPAECCSGGCRRPNFRRAAVFQKPLAVHNYPGQQKVSETEENDGKWVKKLLFETEKIWKPIPASSTRK